MFRVTRNVVSLQRSLWCDGIPQWPHDAVNNCSLVLFSGSPDSQTLENETKADTHTCIELSLTLSGITEALMRNLNILFWN